MLINLSNHPYEKWPEDQKNEAAIYGEVINLPFPAVRPTATSGEIDDLVNEYLARIQTLVRDSQAGTNAVMVQGEFVFTYRLVNELKKSRIAAVAAITERIVQAETLSDGTVRKTSLFVFRGFREY